jgi:hypothetical protein
MDEAGPWQVRSRHTDVGCATAAIVSDSQGFRWTNWRTDDTIHSAGRGLLTSKGPCSFEKNMNISVLRDIEMQIGQLTIAEKQILLERLARDLRAAKKAQQQAALTAMAADADIQREIREIEQEFADAAEDGLENV